MKAFQLHSKIGSLGEGLAERYLKSRGHRVLARNYYFDKGKRSGEIDIITTDKGILHFIEVKTKTITANGKISLGLTYPIEAQVTRAKIQKMAKTAEHYLRASRKQDQEYHFDVVTVLYNQEEKKADIRFIQDVFF